MSLILKNYFPQLIEIAPNISLVCLRSIKFSAESSLSVKKIKFNIDGELIGKIQCSIDSQINNQEFGIFVEAMNILIGHTLSNIENNEDLTANLGVPLLDKNLSLNQNSIHYCLKINNKEFKCILTHNLQEYMDKKLIKSSINHQKEGTSYA